MIKPVRIIWNGTVESGLTPEDRGRKQMDFLNDPRFAGIEKFEKKVWLSSPTMHGDEQKWVDEAIRTNWVSTVGANINAVEEQIADYVATEPEEKILIIPKI